MLVRLLGSCKASSFWDEVRQRVEELADSLPWHARGWSVTLRRKTTADDLALVDAGEAEEPAGFWYVLVNDHTLEVTIGVPAGGDEDLPGVASTAAFIVELLDQIANPILDDS